MNRFVIARNIAISAAVVFSFSVARAADDLPKADTVLDKYVEVTGGKAAYEKHHSETSKGTLEIASQGIKGSITSYRAEPNKSYSETELGGFGKIREGSDGTTFWALSAMTGPHIKDGAEKVQAQLSAMNSELHWRDLFKDVKTTGVDTVNGKECYKLQVTPADSSPMEQCYDKISGLMVKQSMTVESPYGPQSITTFAGDYRKEDGVLVPHQIKSSVAGQDIVVTIDSVTYNADIPPGTFALPDEIKALVKK
ncbi:MAG TPA: DUF620 domain-containing protein [Bryobacteraceae bacterium]|jgi:hypothetical protein|nr:DUF620 domain-containing protein [Bryobacteraceae bacterium]